MNESEAMKFEWFRAYVGQCLAEHFEGSVPPTDEDEDWVIMWDSSPIYISARSEPHFCSEVWTVAARGIRSRVAVLREINDLNLRMTTAKAVLMPGGSVIIRQRLIAEGVNAVTLNEAVMAVGVTAERVGVMMTSMFDGYEPFAVEVPVEDA